MAGKGVRYYHMAWLQHIKQGRAAWGEENKKKKLRKALVWQVATCTNSKSAPNSAAISWQNTQAPWVQG